ncbi:transcriptional regulator [Prauserella coralliicola]|nr:transcriptional regulator [Prauserella coralliicola]
MAEKSPLDGLRVLAHPLRLRILSLLTAAPMSAAEAARELGESQANVSYHLRRLAEAGLLYVAEEVSIRGGRAKRYRHDPESGTGFLGREPAEEPVLLTALADELHRRASYRAPGRPASLIDAEVWVDEQTWERARELSLRLSEVLHDAAKPPRTPGTNRVSATVALFMLENGGGE